MAHTHHIPATVTSKTSARRLATMILRLAGPALDALTKDAPHTDRLDDRLLDRTKTTRTASQQRRLFDIAEAIRWQLPR